MQKNHEILTTYGESFYFFLRQSDTYKTQKISKVSSITTDRVLFKCQEVQIGDHIITSYITSPFGQDGCVKLLFCLTSDGLDELQDALMQNGSSIQKFYFENYPNLSSAFINGFCEEFNKISLSKMVSSDFSFWALFISLDEGVNFWTLDDNAFSLPSIAGKYQELLCAAISILLELGSYNRSKFFGQDFNDYWLKRVLLASVLIVDYEPRHKFELFAQKGSYVKNHSFSAFHVGISSDSDDFIGIEIKEPDIKFTVYMYTNSNNDKKLLVAKLSVTDDNDFVKFMQDESLSKMYPVLSRAYYNGIYGNQNDVCLKRFSGDGFSFWGVCTSMDNILDDTPKALIEIYDTFVRFNKEIIENKERASGSGSLLQAGKEIYEVGKSAYKKYDDITTGVAAIMSLLYFGLSGGDFVGGFELFKDMKSSTSVGSVVGHFFDN